MDALGSSHVFLFDRFRLNRRGGGLFSQDANGAWEPVEIGGRALEVLGVLVERYGDLVTRDEIMRVVWPGTAVEDNNLTVQISALRSVLDEGRGGGSCIQRRPEGDLSGPSCGRSRHGQNLGHHRRPRCTPPR